MEWQLRLSEPECNLPNAYSEFSRKHGVVITQKYIVVGHTNGMWQHEQYHRAQNDSEHHRPERLHDHPPDCKSQTKTLTKWRWSNMMTTWNSLDLTSQVSDQAQKQETQLYLICGLFNLAMMGRSSTSYPSLRTLSGMRCHRGYRCQVNQWHGSEWSSMLCQSKRGSSRTFSPWNMWCPSSVITSLTIRHIVRQIKMTENEDSGVDWKELG